MNNIKKIYKIYTNNKGEIHHEVFPVIYQNSDYVYFKVPGSKTLDFVSLSRVIADKDVLLDLISKSYSDYFAFYTFFEPDNISKKEFRIHKLNYELDCRKKHIEGYQEDIKKINKYIDKENRSIDIINKELAELNGEQK